MTSSDLVTFKSRSLAPVACSVHLASGTFKVLPPIVTAARFMQTYRRRHISTWTSLRIAAATSQACHRGSSYLMVRVPNVTGAKTRAVLSRENGRFATGHAATPLLDSNRVERRHWRLALRASVARLHRARISSSTALGEKNKRPRKGAFCFSGRAASPVRRVLCRAQGTVPGHPLRLTASIRSAPIPRLSRQHSSAGAGRLA